MIKIWYNVRSGYIIQYIYNTENGELRIARQQYQGLKNIPHYQLKH
jgi:hypothetical protein